MSPELSSHMDGRLVCAASDNRDILHNATSFTTYFNVPMSFQVVNIPYRNGINDLDKMSRRSEGRRICGCECKSRLRKLTELRLKDIQELMITLLLCPIP